MRRLRYKDGLLLWECEPKDWFPAFRRALADSIEDADGNLHSEKDGRFVSEGAEARESPHEPPLDKKEAFDAFCGKEFKGVEGLEAIRTIRREKRGHVKAAFFRREIGNIAVAWGNKRAGLDHIITKRLETDPKLDIDALFKKLADVIAHGDIYFNKKKKTYEIWYKEEHCAISKGFYGSDVNFVITAFPSRRKPGRFSRAK